MNLHLRMERILALIEANPGITGQKIADACAVPWPVIKKDLETMAFYNESYIPLYTDQDLESTEDDDCELVITPAMKWYLNTTNRKHVPIHLTVGEDLQILDMMASDQQQRSLSLKQKIVNTLDLENEGTYRYLKGNMSPVVAFKDEVLLLIEQAIFNHRKISFTYDSGMVTIAPLGLVYYSRLKQWYLVAQKEDLIKTFNLNKLEDLKETKETFTYPLDFSLKEWLRPHWGMEFGTPFNVKVRFINRAQTITKVRKDVAHRQGILTEEQDGESLVYEDTIIGRNEFIAWILGFGSAAIVLEPRDIRDEIIERVKATLGNYL